MTTVHAIFENGVFRPTEPVELPEHTEVDFEPRITNGGKHAGANMKPIYEILSRRYDSGDPDLATRHNEHQP
jgi:predicted DNA-binding antitoxin AbrB/MazE fold protein